MQIVLNDMTFARIVKSFKTRSKLFHPIPEASLRKLR